MVCTVTTVATMYATARTALVHGPPGPYHGDRVFGIAMSFGQRPGGGDSEAVAMQPPRHTRGRLRHSTVTGAPSTKQERRATINTMAAHKRALMLHTTHSSRACP